MGFDHRSDDRNRDFHKMVDSISVFVGSKSILSIMPFFINLLKIALFSKEGPCE